MIIRVVSIVSLILLLILVLYLPSAHPPERFITQLGVEHERNNAFLGEERALHILSRMLALHTDAKEASPIPDTLASARSHSQVDSAAASEMSQMSTRLFNNQYFKSIGALFALATYRFSTFVEWLPYVSVFVVAALLDEADAVRKARPSCSTTWRICLIGKACSIVRGDRIWTVWGQGRVLPVTGRCYL